MTPREASERLEKYGWGLGCVERSGNGWVAEAVKEHKLQWGRTRSAALSDLVARVEAMEGAR